MKQLSLDALNRPDIEQYKTSGKIPVVVILDNIRSGLNVGAIFRSSDAFSIEAVWLCGITVQPPHAEVMKTALGATDSVNWFYRDTTIEAVEELQQSGYTVMPVEQTDKSVMLDQIDLPEKFPIALILGNELRGISADVLSLCESSVEIPQEGIKHSLNVATTAGIVLWECYRQFRLRRLSSSEL